jgi:hypothetical protein
VVEVGHSVDSSPEVKVPLQGLYKETHLNFDLASQCSHDSKSFNCTNGEDY